MAIYPHASLESGREKALRIGGCVTELVTPFRNRSFDEDAFSRLVHRQIESGVQGLAPTSTLGEAPTLSRQEHQRVVEVCVREANGRIPVIAGASSNSTLQAIELCKDAEDVGADALLATIPYYNKPTQDGVYEHFKAIHAAVGLPIIIDDTPGRSAISLSDRTLFRLRELPRIVGIKDGTGDLARPLMRRIMLGSDFIQLSGRDLLIVAFMAEGGNGCFSATSNLAPRQCSRIVERCESGDYKSGLELQIQLGPLHEVLDTDDVVPSLKFALHIAQGISSETRLPLTSLSAQAKARINETLSRLPGGALGLSGCQA